MFSRATVFRVLLVIPFLSFLPPPAQALQPDANQLLSADEEVWERALLKLDQMPSSSRGPYEARLAAALRSDDPILRERAATLLLWMRSARPDFRSWLRGALARSDAALMKLQRESEALFRTIRQTPLRIAGPGFRDDPEAGYRLASNRTGYYDVPGLPHVGVCTDKDGFRVPCGTRRSARKRGNGILTLGCSFSFGALCPAESTYPELVAAAVGGRALNASAPGYGLAQMLVMARRWIPAAKPKIVVAQYSPWLLDRSLVFFAPTPISAKRACPYFFERPDGAIAVHRPVYPKLDLTPQQEKILSEEKNLSDFSLGVGLEIAADAAIKERIFRKKRDWNMVEEPTSQQRKALLYGYSEIAALAEKHGAKLYVLVLTNGTAAPESDIRDLESIRGVTVVDAAKVLLERVGNDAGAYARAYGHFQDETMLDSHPNVRAHKTIAEALLERIAQ
jgi:hypothetical protein